MKLRVRNCKAQADLWCRYMYPHPDFIKETIEAFPDQGVANVEEARVR